MMIALDYDKTYTLDPEFWDSFISSASKRGHEVFCATMRHETEPIEIPCAVIYTSRKAKAAYLKERGIVPDIWIDDNPAWLYTDG